MNNTSILWEEKNLIEQPTKLESNQTFVRSDGINEIKNESVKNGCEDIGKRKEWKRNCPNCGKELIYSSKRWFYTNRKYNKVCRSCIRKLKGLHPPSKEGIKLLSNHKIKIGKSIKEWHKTSIHPMLGKKHKIDTILLLKESHKGNNNGMYGKKHTLKTRLKISKTRIEKRIPGPKMTDEGLRILRVKRIMEIEKDKFNGNQVIPSFNKKSCEVFKKLNEKLNLSGMFATNGGEYHIKKLGYFLDYYEPNKNVVIEWDERNHYNVDGTLKNDDVRRQKEITNYLKCRFYRINQGDFNEEKVIKEINDYITNKQ